MGYMDCSISVNIATDYGRRMSMRMWPAINAYGGQVVQSWTPSGNGGAWPAFESAKSTYGTPTDIWMQICIFAQQGVTAAEVQTMIRNARSHAPKSRIWINDQPTYNSKHTCSLADNDDAELTDMRAREAANAADNVFYAGTFLLRANVSPSEVATDTCHASPAGELALGDQFIAKFGR